jgi:hypothetical protein|tara:strand:- start:1981 stop:2154 length:174 start_codon:yes stop_codon:yes gene_type:complete
MDVMKRRFNSKGVDDYGVRGDKVVIGLEDVKDIIKNVFKKELVDKLEDEIRKKIIRE